MKELIFASNNHHKLSEVREMMKDSLRILSLDEIQFIGELPETTGTIAGNAHQKAETLYQLTGKNCFADDSGLEVFALDRQPGVDSAFYAGPQKNSDDNNQKLLKELEGKLDRSARFITFISLVMNGVFHQFEGSVSGTIAMELSGENGFGYDPLFIPEGYKHSFAVLPAQLKDLISHRAKAVQKLKEYIENSRFQE
jgi:XTP/dITP diphosphohydrolase